MELTNINAAFINLNVMNAICLEYTDLSSAALIKIFQIADILGVTPKEAAQIYLAQRAKQQIEEGKAA